MAKEKWIDIKGYEGRYQISNQGRVKSLSREFQISFEKKARSVRGKILNMTPNTNGYLRVFLSKHSQVKTHYVHRLVAQHFCPQGIGQVEVNHINGDKLNNSVDNLEWCTKHENLHHAFDNNLCKWGEQSNLRSLTEKQVHEIRREIFKGVKVSEIANKFLVSESTIFRIKSGKTWSRLPVMQERSD